MVFTYIKTSYENIYEWARNNPDKTCYYCSDQEESNVVMPILNNGQGICEHCLTHFEVGNLAADRHVIEQLLPETCDTKEKTVEWLKQFGQLEYVDSVYLGEPQGHIYLYNFINNSESYEAYKEKIASTEHGVFSVDASDFASYTRVEIREDGSIHIVY